MFGWGKRRGSEGRARNNNVYADGDRSERRERPDYATPEVTEVIVYVPTPRPITELAIIIAFTVGLAITAEAVLLALSVQFGTRSPLDVNVEHVNPCFSSGAISLAAQAQQILPLKNADRSERRDDDERSGITIYVPCDVRDTGDRRYGGRSDRDDRGGYLGAPQGSAGGRPQ